MEGSSDQRERQPQYSLLYSLQGFRFCDLLLADAEKAMAVEAMLSGAVEASLREVERRAEQTLEWAEEHLGPFDIAHDHLTLGRVRLYRALLNGSSVDAAKDEIEQAVDGLRNRQDYLPRGLLTRAWLRAAQGRHDDAVVDLAEAEEIAARGPMPLFLADVNLSRARLFHDRAALAEARRLVDKHTYGRREQELAALEAASQS